MARMRKPKAPWWRRAYGRIVRMNGSPGQVAGGFAIGVFLGIAPSFGFGAVLAAALSSLFRANMMAALLGSVTGIPFVAPFIWLASSWLGGLILGVDWQALYEKVRTAGVLKAGPEALYAFALGNLILTVVGTALSYFVVRRLVVSYRARARGRRGRAR